MSDSDAESTVISESESGDIFHRMMGFLDTHSEKFKDGDYKTIVDDLAAARKRSTNFWRITVYCPTMTDSCHGCIGWKKMVCTVALNEADQKLVESSRLIHPLMLMHQAQWSILENTLFDLHTTLLPVVKMSLIDPADTFQYLNLLPLVRQANTTV